MWKLDGQVIGGMFVVSVVIAGWVFFGDWLAARLSRRRRRRPAH